MTQEHERKLQKKAELEWRDLWAIVHEGMPNLYTWIVR